MRERMNERGNGGGDSSDLQKNTANQQYQNNIVYRRGRGLKEFKPQSGRQLGCL